MRALSFLFVAGLILAGCATPQEPTAAGPRARDPVPDCLADGGTSAAPACVTDLVPVGPGTNSTPPIERPARPALEAACFPGANASSDGACARTLDPGPDRDREASIASHPTDPGTVLATWRVGEFGDGPRIEAAYTSDGGATWTLTELRNPAVPDLPMTTRYSYDSIARFGPDGTAYILYGGEYRFVNAAGAAYAFPEFRMTLASSKDGKEWTYHAFSELPTSAVGPDYMDLAVSPDTGRLIVAAQMFGIMPVITLAGCGLTCAWAEGIWTWTSDDAGASWSPPNVVIRNDPLGAGVLPFHYLPRLAAGPGKTVILTTNAQDGDDLKLWVTRSDDDGATWGTPTAVHTFQPDGTQINAPAALWMQNGTLQAALVVGDGDHVVGYRSADGGLTWGQPQDLMRYPAGATHIWLRAEARDAAVWAEARYGADEGDGDGPASFGIAALRWEPDAVYGLRVVNATIEGGWHVGDDYGAVAAAADGTAWLAWSDPRGSELERISVAHVGLGAAGP